MSHEDIRRSLEVLDSVLAEFDDCLESWDSLTQDVRDDDSNRILKEKDLFFSNGNLSTTSFTYGSKTIDGDTSHDSGLSLQEQSKVTSPPPIPKRSATTKLSDRNSGLFTFPLVTSQSFDSLQSESSVLDNDASLSPSDAISIVSAKEDDEVFKHKDNNAQFHCCTKCGCEIEAPMKGHMMENKQERDMSSSPFSERRKMFEDRIGESRINVSPLLERSFNGSSFKVKTDRTKECESEPTSLTFYKSGENDRSDSSHSSFASKYSPKATKVAPPRVGLLSLPNNLHHAPNCNCKERIRELQMKFAETRRLLKSNKIKGLDKRPPSFVPPPPLEVVSKNIRNEIQDSNKQRTNGLENSLISEFKDYYTSNGNANLDSLTSEENSGSFHSNPSIESEENSIHNSLQEKLCHRCSKSVHLPLSETIEDIPKLLPTDALKRPHLGLSYSMEDDLCPGVKEILQTSTPRSGLLSRTHKTASLSTFSLSDSSLGYVSSQSDLELSNSPIKPEKVPVSTLKCSTLPEAGMDLHSLPSYYGHDADPENERKSSQPVYKDRNFNNTSDPQLRSSSAPPLPETEKPKKKHFRVFSRKEKKDKKTNGELNTELVPGAKLS